MKKIKFTVLSASVILMFSLSGCQQAPNEVKKENDLLNKTSAVDKAEVKLEYASMDEIRANAEKENDENNTNVQAKYVRVSGGDSMPAYTLKKYNDNYSDISDIAEYCYDVSFDEISEFLVTYEHKTDYPDSSCKGSLCYIPEGNDVFSCLMSSDCCGFAVSYSNNSYRYADSYPVVKDYKLFMGDDPGNDSYVMSDGKELYVRDAVDSVEKLFNEHISALSDNELIYRVKELIVHKYDDGNYGFEYDMEYSDREGNIIAGCLKTYWNAEGFDNGKTPWIHENDCHGYVIDSVISPFAYQDIIPIKNTETDKGEKLITYSTAVNQISSQLAIEKLYSVDIASLEYVITCPAEPGLIVKDSISGELLDLDILSYSHDDRREMEMRPFWVFRNFEYNSTDFAYSGGCIMVDAINGNVYLY